MRHVVQHNIELKLVEFQRQNVPVKYKLMTPAWLILFTLRFLHHHVWDSVAHFQGPPLVNEDPHGVIFRGRQREKQRRLGKQSTARGFTVYTPLFEVLTSSQPKLFSPPEAMKDNYTAPPLQLVIQVFHEAETGPAFFTQLNIFIQSRIRHT